MDSLTVATEDDHAELAAAVADPASVVESVTVELEPAALLTDTTAPSTHCVPSATAPMSVHSSVPQREKVCREVHLT